MCYKSRTKRACAAQPADLPVLDPPSISPSPLLLTNFPTEIQCYILEYLFTPQRLHLVERMMALPKAKKKRNPKASRRTPQFVNVLLVSKMFVDPRLVMDNIIQNATIVLKRSHFDNIDDFFDERQRCLIKHVVLDWNIEEARVKGQMLHTEYAEIRRSFPHVRLIELEMKMRRGPVLSFDPREPPRGRKFITYAQVLLNFTTTDLWRTPGAWVDIMNTKQFRGTVEIFQNPYRRTNEEVDFAHRPDNPLAISDFAAAIDADKGYWGPHITKIINLRVSENDCDCYEEQPNPLKPSTICHLAVFLRNAHKAGVEVRCPAQLLLTNYRKNCNILFKSAYFSTRDSALCLKIGNFEIRLQQESPKQLFGDRIEFEA